MSVRRLDTPKGRFYQELDDENQVVRTCRGITDILSETKKMSIGFQKYFGQKGYEGGIEYRDKMGVRGTALHIAVGQFLQGLIVDTHVPLTWHEVSDVKGVDVVLDPFDDPSKAFEWDRASIRMFEGACHWFVNNKVEVRFIEHTVFHPELPIAGTLDLGIVLPDDEGLCILDLKATSAIQEDHEIQLAIYTDAFIKRYKMPIRKSGIARMYDWRKEPTMQVRWVDSHVLEKRRQQFIHRFEDWLLGGGLTELPDLDPVPRVFSIEEMQKKLEETKKEPEKEIERPDLTLEKESAQEKEKTDG